jgi:hypothetical protein
MKRIFCNKRRVERRNNSPHSKSLKLRKLQTKAIQTIVPVHDIHNFLYDLVFCVARNVVKYNEEEHGIWQIYKNEFNGL